MIIYNVTINVEDSIHDEWMKWMKQEHMPEVVATGCFSFATMFKILVEEQSGTSYAVQYKAPNMSAIDRYLKDFAPSLRQKGVDKFGDKFTAFRTLLEEI